MKTIDLSKGQPSLSEVLALAKSETIFIHSDSGEDFLLEHADEFDREVAALVASEKFISFLESRSKETGEISISQIREKFST
jgi:hypothetical protein